MKTYPYGKIHWMRIEPYQCKKWIKTDPVKVYYSCIQISWNWIHFKLLGVWKSRSMEVIQTRWVNRKVWGHPWGFERHRYLSTRQMKCLLVIFRMLVSQRWKWLGEEYKLDKNETGSFFLILVHTRTMQYTENFSMKATFSPSPGNTFLND